MKHVLHPLADAELTEAFTYYCGIDPELGQRFLHEMGRLMREACAQPQRVRRFDPPARRHFGTWFPYAVIYLDQPDRVWIVAIMHMKRRPGYWRDRLD